MGDKFNISPFKRELGDGSKPFGLKLLDGFAQRHVVVAWLPFGGVVLAFGSEE